MLEEVPALVGAAGRSVLDVGVVGALLLLSLAGNVALVWALVRCWRSQAGVIRNDEWGGPY